MSDNDKRIKEMSPSEFAEKWEKTTGKKVVSKSRGSFKGFIEILGALGLFPVFSSKSSGRRGHRHVGGGYHSSNSFKESYCVEQTPRARTHEEMVREHIAHDAYMDLVDGKGDDER